MIPAPALQQLHMDPEQPVPVESDGALLADAPAGAIDALVALAGPDAETPLLTVELRHLGGALARHTTGGGAHPRMDARYVMFAGGIAEAPEIGHAVRAHLRAIKDALTPWRAAYDYYNFAETPTGADAMLPREAHRRLRGIKRSYDPDEVIVSAHPVRPSAGMAAPTDDDRIAEHAQLVDEAELDRCRGQAGAADRDILVSRVERGDGLLGQ